MKNLFTLVMMATFFCCSTLTVQSQCTPNPAYLDSGVGVYPHPLADGCLNQNYTDTITVVTFSDTTVAIPFPPFVLTVPLDSIHIDNVSNLPPGLIYTCGSANCMFYPNGNGDPLTGCVEISGFPTSSMPNDSIEVTVTGYVTILGSVTSLAQTAYTTLDLPGSATGSTLNETACGSYTLNGQTYTVSGNYVQILTNSSGCDSTISIGLTIIDIDETVTLNGNTLTANTTGAVYQWIDCDNGNQPIVGEINQSFTPTTSGNYAVIVTENGCTETSACTAVNIIGIDETVWVSGVKVYPNPVGQLAVISTLMAGKEKTLSVFDILGKEIYSTVFSAANFQLPTADWKSGIYFLEVTLDEMVSRLKLIKN